MTEQMHPFAPLPTTSLAPTMSCGRSTMREVRDGGPDDTHTESMLRTPSGTTAYNNEKAKLHKKKYKESQQHHHHNKQKH